MQLVIFDDKQIENFYPLTLTRSTGDLRVGILKQRQRLRSYFEDEKTRVIIPEILAEMYKERHKDWQVNELDEGEVLFVNSRLQPSDEILEQIDSLSNKILKYKEEIVAAHLVLPQVVSQITEIDALVAELPQKQLKKNCLWHYLWELVNANAQYIQSDFKTYFYDQDNYFETETGVTILDPYNIWLGENAKLYPGVVLDASHGPIVVDEEAKIMANSYIQGPCYIGKRSIIKALARIYEGTTIGPVCKVGGELEETIIQAYSNKQHGGFLGHSYLGEWVNLGAATNNSDLKNNYSSVKVYSYRQNQKIDSNSTFVGTYIGDHSKTAINTTIYTGTVIGIGCNIFGNKYANNFVRNFTWGNPEKAARYEFEKFLQTADLVKKRRDLCLTKAEKELYNQIYKMKFASKK
jgi:UDP-N-acetylglucosamine diphosphorylase/glucosamine-1-phosphate N-acetyltransferase